MHRSHHWTILVGCLSAMVLSACGKSKEASTESSPTEQQATASEEQAAQAEIAEADLPIAEDFADEAEESITPDNYSAELKRIEEELEAELVQGDATAKGGSKQTS